jgi:hypothetical protein
MGEFFLRRSPPRAADSGQVAVEAALVMPLFVFLILGILQLGLIAQARVMAKYAAYRAARVGAMNHADPKAIEAAAIFHLLPVLVDGKDLIQPTATSSDVAKKFSNHMGSDNKLPGGTQMVTAVICAPLKSELDGGGSRPLDAAGQQARGGQGTNAEIDFDDPANQGFPAAYIRDANAVRRFRRLRLAVQVQLLYRMPIPFANWVIVNSYLGVNLPSVLMMPGKGVTERAKTSQVNAVIKAAKDKAYVVPINVSYSMRMQSNLFMGRFKPPEKNECITYGNPG